MGDIYIGVVESILENLDIAFVKLDEWKENGFMVLKNEFFFTSKENIKLGEDENKVAQSAAVIMKPNLFSIL